MREFEVTWRFSGGYEVHRFTAKDNTHLLAQLNVVFPDVEVSRLHIRELDNMTSHVTLPVTKED